MSSHLLPSRFLVIYAKIPRALIIFLYCALFSSVQRATGDDTATNTSEGINNSRLFGYVELANNILEDGYSQTNHSFGVISEVGFLKEQFRAGIRGNNVFFPNEASHLTLQPYLGIIAHFDEQTKIFVEYEHRMYYSESRRNAGKVTVGFDMNDYSFRHQSLDNWWGLHIPKSRFAAHYRARWNFSNLYSEFVVGYNAVGEVNTPNFFDFAVNVNKKSGNIRYFFEVVGLSQVVPYIANSSPLSYRVGAAVRF
ncbi:MAG: hypothetical protein RMK80_04820 [Pseudobdellovibrionaceae bacterium]|nr:hypothetical protein [Pseudobdellovibrionaceae bacterium]